MPLTSSSGFPFTENGILLYAPRRSGVYGIYKDGKWIYIGESEDMEARLFEHLRGQSHKSACIILESPTGFICDSCDATTRVIREKLLIAQLSPVCNG